jgi:hypothetical protein
MDIGKIIDGFECCINNERTTPDCEHCPYLEIEGICTALHILHGDALAALKEMQPRQITYEEAVNARICCIEDKDGDIEWPVEIWEGWGYVEVTEMGVDSSFRRISHQYGKTWRCWNKEPTKEQAKAAKWEK